MGEVIISNSKFEEARIQKESPNFIKEGDIIDFTLLQSEIFALTFINSYLGFENKPIIDIINVAIKNSKMALNKLHEFRELESLLKNKKFYWNHEYEKEKNSIDFNYNIKEPELFNTFLEEYNFSLDNVFEIFTGFYIQSFVDVYNGFENNYILPFPKKEEVRKNAMLNHQSDVIKFLNEYTHIYGFDSASVFSEKSEKNFNKYLKHIQPGFFID